MEDEREVTVPTFTKLVCAWCKTLIAGDVESTLTSHGICSRCAEILRTGSALQALVEKNRYQRCRGSAWSTAFLAYTRCAFSEGHLGECEASR